MGWVRLEDDFDSHPKTCLAGNEAAGLFVRSIAHANAHLTDGHITAAWLRERAGRRGPALAAHLVDVGLWEVDGDGWQIHDYLDRQPSRAVVLAKRRAEQERKDKQRNGGARAR